MINYDRCYPEHWRWCAKAIEVMTDLKVPLLNEIIIEDSSRTTQVFGRCYKKKSFYLIRMNPTLEEEVYISTLIHELLHTVSFSDGHRGLWKKYADYISKNSSYAIKRLGALNTLPSFEEKSKMPKRSAKDPKLKKYSFICPICGNKAYVWDTKFPKRILVCEECKKILKFKF